MAPVGVLPFVTVPAPPGSGLEGRPHLPARREEHVSVEPVWPRTPVPRGSQGSGFMQKLRLWQSSVMCLMRGSQ